MKVTVPGLVAALTLGLLAAILTAEAQQTVKIQRVGLLGLGSAAALADAAGPFAAFRAALRDRGYVEGRNVVIEGRWAEGKPERLPQLAQELIDLRVDVIVAGTVPTARAAKQATSTVPIVFVAIGDPVSAGLVSSLARPGGNVTGLSFQVTPEQAAKELEILHELSPKANRVALLQDPTFKSYATPYRERVQPAARGMNLTFHVAEFQGREDLDTALAGILDARAAAVWVMGTYATFTHRGRIADFAKQKRLPSLSSFREFVEAGGLASYGASLPDVYRRAAGYVDRILKGAKPGDLPVEQPTKFELVINLKTAKALDLTIPQSIVVRADHLIE